MRRLRSVRRLRETPNRRATDNRSRAGDHGLGQLSVLADRPLDYRLWAVHRAAGRENRIDTAELHGADKEETEMSKQTDYALAPPDRSTISGNFALFRRFK